MIHNIVNEEPRSFLTVNQFANKYPAFSVSSLRWLIFNEATNGLSAAFVRVGRRVLIDERRFFEVISEKNRAT